MVILELIHAKNPDFGRDVFIRLKANALRGFLVSYQSNTQGDFWALNGGRKTIGRANSGEQVDIPLSDATISSRHAAIVVDGVAGFADDFQWWPFSATFVTVASSPPAATDVNLRGHDGTSVRATLTIPAGDLAEIIIRSAVGTTPPASPTAGAAAYSGVDPSPLITPRPGVSPVVGPAGAPATSTGPAPSTGGPGTGTPRPQPVQAPAQVPRR